MTIIDGIEIGIAFILGVLIINYTTKIIKKKKK